MPSQQPLLTPMPMPTLGIDMVMDMVSAIEAMAIEDTMVMPGPMDMDMDTGERRKDQLMPSLLLSLQLMLMLGTVPMDMAMDTMDMVLDTMAMDMAGHTMD